MTSGEFLAFYPQFGSVIPPIVLSTYIDSANARFADFFEDASEARRLYVAHKLTLYAKTMPASEASEAGSSSYASLASSGDGSRITSKKVDDVAVTYASGSSSSSSESSFADLPETVYGLQLLSLLRMYSWPRYVP